MAIENLERLLAEHPFFKDLQAPHLGTVVGCASNTTFAPDDVIFSEGGAADRFYLLRYGKVGVLTFVPGRGAITIETIEPGEVIGWSWLFPPYKAHFDVRALTLTRAVSLDGACLRKKCEQDPVLGYELMKRFASVMMQRLEATRIQLLDLYADRP